MGTRGALTPMGGATPTRYLGESPRQMGTVGVGGRHANIKPPSLGFLGLNPWDRVTTQSLSHTAILRPLCTVPST